MIALHSRVLVVIAFFALPLIGFYINVSRRSNAAHLKVLQTSDAGRVTNCSSWQRLERWRFSLGVLFASMLAIIFWMRFIAGDSWSLIDKVSFWTVGLTLVSFVVAAEHYNLEDLFVSLGVGRRVRIMSPQ